ncbi:nucleolar protein 14 homolog [Leptidea sinapis]|uniref:nucleolar protein 14 homolog n=1 Tax=Leptidea sinapis TaxID=189913 RepID=UPI002130FE20|nr:nucleolar protein 14 homolog [Leptidea sinapis]
MAKVKNKRNAGLADRVQKKKKLDGMKKSLNPFEVHINREKIKVLGKKSKHDRGLPGVSRAKAIQKRKDTLGTEIKLMNKTNAFIDRRIGEKDNQLSAEDRMIARFAAERARQHTKKSIYNLADDEILTHRGQTLEQVEKFDDPRSDDEDGEKGFGGLDDDFVSDGHFGGGILSKTEAKDGAKSHKDLIEQLIAESKKRKAEKQKEKEQTLDLTEKLDTEWKDLQPVVLKRQKTDNEESLIDKLLNKAEKGQDYDKMMRELRFEKRGVPSDALKSTEKLQEEERKKLEEFERARQQRMLPQEEEGRRVVQPTVKHRSADDLDDNFQLDDEKEIMLAYDKDGKPLLPEHILNDYSVPNAKKKFDDGVSDTSSEESDGEDESDDGENTDEKSDEVVETENDSEVKKTIEVNGEESDSGSDVESNSNLDELLPTEDLLIEEKVKGASEEKIATHKSYDNVLHCSDDRTTSNSRNEESNSDDETTKNEPSLFTENANRKRKLPQSNSSEKTVKLDYSLEDNFKIKNDKKELFKSSANDEKDRSNSDENESNNDSDDNSDNESEDSDDDHSDKGSDGDKSKDESDSECNLGSLFDMKSNEGIQLKDLLRDKSPVEQSATLKKIIKSHDPGLSANNKEYLSRLFAYLLQYINDVFTNLTKEVDIIKSFLIFDKIAPFFYDLIHINKVSTKKFLVELIKEKHDNFKKNVKRVPDLDTLVFFKLVSLLYPTSDFRHPVTTPCLIFMTEILSQSRFKDAYSLSRGLFILTLVLEYTSLSKRFVPEAINFLRGILYLSANTSLLNPVQLVPPFKLHRDSKILNLEHDCSKMVIENKMAAGDLAVDAINDRYKIRSLVTSVLILREFFDNYIEIEALNCIFEPHIQLLGRVDVDFYPKDVCSILNEVTQYMKETLEMKTFVPMAREKVRPKALRLYEPDVQDVFTGKNNPKLSREATERKHLETKYKKEMKGALREIRRDNSFIASVKLRQKIQSDNMRKEKVKQIYKDASIQQGELNKLKRGK